MLLKFSFTVHHTLKKIALIFILIIKIENSVSNHFILFPTPFISTLSVDMHTFSMSFAI